MHHHLFVAVTLLFMGCLSSCQGNIGNENPFDKIVPSTNLTWHQCYGDLRCSKLIVPIDYGNKALGTTHIAFMQRPGKNATAGSPSIIILPGGPGGSGNAFILQNSDRIGRLFDEQYNVVSFDPRGVGDSGLTIDCFMGNTTTSRAYARLHNINIVDLTGNILHEQFYSSAIYADWCDEAVTKEYPYAYYVTTPASAQDLLTFTEAEAVLHGRLMSEAKLWAYGASYGTVVGATFASMFPDRIERLVLDGVLTADQYYDNIWFDAIDQGDEATREFANLCHSAGPDKCAYWGPSPADILDRLDALIEHLLDQPMPVSGLPGTGLPTMITYSDIKALLLDSISNALEMFPIMADTLHQLELGNASALASYADFRVNPVVGGSNPQIRCGDCYKRNRLATFENFKHNVEEMSSVSKYIGDIWAISADSMLCSAFNSNLPDSMLPQGPISAIDTPTAFPILLTSNTIDPITSLKSAYVMSSLFAGSVVLRQEAIGHTVVNQGGSVCYYEHILKYFAGVVPEANITCPAQYIPFIDAMPV